MCVPIERALTLCLCALFVQQATQRDVVTVNSSKPEGNVGQVSTATRSHTRHVNVPLSRFGIPF